MRQATKVIGMSDWYLGLLGLVFESDTLQKKMDHTVWDFDLYKTKDWHTYYHASKKTTLSFWNTFSDLHLILIKRWATWCQSIGRFGVFCCASCQTRDEDINFLKLYCLDRSTSHKVILGFERCLLLFFPNTTFLPCIRWCPIFSEAWSRCIRIWFCMKSGSNNFC